MGAEDDVLERGREDDVAVDFSNMVPASNKRFKPPASVVVVVVVVIVGTVDVVAIAAVVA